MRTALVVIAMMLGPAAHADLLTATRGQDVAEVAHTVDIKLLDGVATYTVRRTFKNTGKLADQVELEVRLPPGAAATGLRIRARDRWYDGDLMERERAAALYQELTGYGPHGAKDPALLSWMWSDKLALQVFPVLPGSVSTVEYTLTAPTRYEHGHYVVAYPRVASAADESRQTLALATPVVTVHPAWSDAQLAIDGKRLAPGAAVALVPPAQPEWGELVAAEPTASYVSSTVVVPASRRADATFSRATLALALSHTYQSDLRVELLTPNHERVIIHDRTGGGANNLRGNFAVALPPGTTGTGTWRLVVSDHVTLDTGVLDHWSLVLGEGAERITATAADTPVFIPDAPESARDAGLAAITVTPPPTAVWAARLGRVVASPEHAFARLEVDVAPELVPAPKRAQVVFVVDASYSQGADGVAAQLDVLRAYLGHVPDAEVEVVAYRRRAVRAFGRFVPASRVSAELEAARAAFALGNGSALDDGAALAAAALAGRAGPHRIVLLTDELVRSALSPAAALAALSAATPDTVVHLVIPRLDSDLPELTRDDDAALAALATRHHGLAFRLGGLPSHTLKELAPIVLELVRPTRIEHLEAPGFALESPVLHEGDSVRLMVDVRAAPTSTVLTGTMWSDPVRREVRAGDAFSRSTAAFVFGADEHDNLSPAEMMTVALAGRVVSPVTSYVAAEPGTRPSVIGFPDGVGFSSGRYASIGFGSGSGSGNAMNRPTLDGRIDPAACVARVKPAAPWRVTLDVETTRDEIVDVAPSAAGAMAGCLAEAAWAVRLDSSFFVDRDRFTVQLSGPAAP